MSTFSVPFCLLVDDSNKHITHRLCICERQIVSDYIVPEHQITGYLQKNTSHFDTSSQYSFRPATRPETTPNSLDVTLTAPITTTQHVPSDPRTCTAHERPARAGGVMGGGRPRLSGTSGSVCERWRCSHVSGALRQPLGGRNRCPTVFVIWRTRPDPVWRAGAGSECIFNFCFDLVFISDIFRKINTGNSQKQKTKETRLLTK